MVVGGYITNSFSLESAIASGDCHTLNTNTKKFVSLEIVFFFLFCANEFNKEIVQMQCYLNIKGTYIIYSTYYKPMMYYMPTPLFSSKFLYSYRQERMSRRRRRRSVQLHSVRKTTVLEFLSWDKD